MAIVVLASPGTPSRAQGGISLGSLMCSVGEPAEPAETDSESVGSAFRVLCVFSPENGAQEAYVGTIWAQDDVVRAKRTLVWAVRGLAHDALDPGFLEQNYTIRSARAEGAVAPLVPKDKEDAALALYAFGVEKVNDQKSGKVTTLELRLEASVA